MSVSTCGWFFYFIFFQSQTVPLPYRSKACGFFFSPPFLPLPYVFLFHLRWNLWIFSGPSVGHYFLCLGRVVTVKRILLLGTSAFAMTINSVPFQIRFNSIQKKTCRGSISYFRIVDFTYCGGWNVTPWSGDYELSFHCNGENPAWTSVHETLTPNEWSLWAEVHQSKQQQQQQQLLLLREPDQLLLISLSRSTCGALSKMSYETCSM